MLYVIICSVISLNYINDSYENEIIIEKSKFITTIYPVSSIDDVNQILSSTRKKYYDATHNCYAYILNEGKILNSSDDGEPAKTAGFPILDVLVKNNLDNALCIVTRYFGGILLGAGGLTRAYSSSAAQVIKKAKIYEKLNLNKLIITIDYASYNTIKQKLDCVIIDESFSSSITMTIAIKDENLNNSIDFIQNISKGSAIIVNSGKYDILVPKN